MIASAFHTLLALVFFSLTADLKRFGMCFGLKKLETTVRIPIILDITPFASPETGE